MKNIFTLSGLSRFLLILVSSFIFIASVNGQVSSYSFSESTANAYAPIAGTTAYAVPWDDDNTAVGIPIGFSFTFNGIAYTTCRIITNGYINMGSGNTNANLYVPISSTSTTPGIISAFGINLSSGTDPITYTTLGSSPNQVFVVQWSNAKRVASTGTDNLNFQIRLYEGTNAVEVRYGTCTSTFATALTCQAGLRGATNADFNDRTATTASWFANTSGTLNTSTLSSSSTIMPALNLGFKWSPPSTQTVLLDPITLGGFEGGSATFPPTSGVGPHTLSSLGWTIRDSLNNYWGIGAFASATLQGGFAAYISPAANAGANNNYNATAAIDNKIYRDITFPAGATSIALSFNWKCNGELNQDYLRVNLVPTSTAINNLPLTGGQIGGDFNLSSNIFTLFSTALHDSLAGTTARLVFSFHTNNSVAGNPGAAIDGVSITCNAPAPTCAQPTSLSAGSITANSASVSLVCGSCTGPYILEYGPSLFTPGTNGSPGVNGTIVTGATSPIALTGLNPNTTYDVYVRQDCSGNSNGFSSNSIKITFATPVACPLPTSVSVGSITSSSASVSFSCSSCSGSFIAEYGPVGFIPGAGATPGTNGTIFTGSTSPISLTGLSPSTTYQVYVRQNCTGGGNGFSNNTALVQFLTLCGTPLTGTTGARYPNGNVSNAPVFTVCPSSSFILFLTGATPPSPVTGITYQWRSSLTNFVSDSTNGPTTATWTTSQTTGKYYHCAITCSAGPITVYSPTLFVPTADNCVNMSTGSSVTCFAEFFDDQGPSNKYTANQTQTYTFYPSQGGSALQVVFNSFNTTAGDVMTIYDGNNTSFPVLLNAYSGSISPGTFTSTVAGNGALTFQFVSGATNANGWDATVTCVPFSTPCADPISAGTISGVTSICPTINFTLSLNGYSVGNGITYQWQSSPASQNTWSNLGTNSINLTTSLTASTDYRCITSCAFGSSNTTPAYTVTANSFLSCYCTPAISCFIFNGFYISNVTFGTMSNSSTCNAYQLYNSPVAQLTKAEPLDPDAMYALTVTVPDQAYTGFVSCVAWFDWNQNGAFETSEYVSLGTQAVAPNPPYSFSSNIPLPSSAINGNTLIRIKIKNGTTAAASLPPATDACGTTGNGEIEDYVVNVVPNTCTVPNVGGTAIGPSTIAAGATAGYSLSGQTGNIVWEVSTTSASSGFVAQAGQNGTSMNITFGTLVTRYVRAHITSAGCTDKFSNVITTTVTSACVNATPIACGGINSVAFSLTSPFATEGPATCFGTDLNGATAFGKFYKFTPALSGTTVVTTCGSTFDTKIYIYTGCPTLVCVAGNDDDPYCGGNGTRSLVSFQAVGGTEYYAYIIRSLSGPVSGTLSINVVCPEPPPINDNCAGAVALSCPSATVNSNTIWATVGAEDSNPVCGPATAKSVWYKVDGNGGRITMKTCSFNTNYDTYLSVYSGACGALTCLGSNDDGCTTCVTDAFTLQEQEHQSQFVIPLSVIGTTYYIRVHGAGTASGFFTLTVSCEDPPAPCAVGTASVSPAFACGTSGTNTLTLSSASGDIQWQESLDGGNTWNDITCATSLTYVNTVTTFGPHKYRAVTTGSCTTSQVISNVVDYLLDSPQIPFIAGDITCGPGSVTLTAVSSDGYAVRWYANSIGGSPLANGNNYTLNLSSTNTFYADAFNSVTGCVSQRAAVTGTVGNVPAVSASVIQPVICSGSQTVLNANVTNDIPGSPSDYGVIPISLSPRSTALLTNAGPTGDNAVSASDLSIGFPFTFFGNVYSTFRISSNGNIQFGPAYSASGSVTSLPNASVPNNMIACPWADLLPAGSSGGSGTITWGTIGSAPNRELVVSYNNVRSNGIFNIGPVQTSQIVLKEGSSNIEIHLSQTNYFFQHRVLGIENSDGTLAFVPPNRQPLADFPDWSVQPGDGEAWLFYPPGPNTYAYNWQPSGSLSGPVLGVVTEGNTTPNVTATPGANQVYTVTMTNAITQCTGTASVSVTVNTAPLITCPSSNLDVPTDLGTCGAIINFAASVSGVPTPTVTYSKNPGTVFSQGPTVVTANAINSCGSASCQFTYIVKDHENPVINSNNPLQDIIASNDPGDCGALLNVNAPSFTDNCLGGTISGIRDDSFQLFDQFPVGTTEITWIATDATGINSSTAIQHVIVEDHEQPSISCQGNIVQSNAPGQCGKTVTYNSSSAGDNCGAVTLTYSPASGSFFNVGITPVLVTATDAHGNTSNCFFTVTINDTEAPVITCPANTTVNANAANCKATLAAIGTATATDNCTETPVSIVVVSPAQLDLGTNTVTWQATDASGNTSTCTQTVTVVNTLSVYAGIDETTYYGFSGDQSVTHTAVATGGVGSKTYSWTMNRPLKCNIINNTGDETFSSGTCTNNICPGSPLNLTMGTAPVCTGSATVTAALLDSAYICVTVTDAIGCTATDCFWIFSEDARCFAGTNTKVQICHITGPNSNQRVQLCVDQDAVAAHLAHGDYLGKCSNHRIDESAGESSMQVTVYPTPNNGNFTVDFNSNNSEDIVVSVSDMLGQVVFHKTLSVPDGIFKGVVETGNLENGYYTFRVEQGKEIITKPIVIIR